MVTRIRGEQFFFATSLIAMHEFQAKPFWEPFCELCHEKREHPVHSLRGEHEVCGYDACPYCFDVKDPDRAIGEWGW